MLDKMLRQLEADIRAGELRVIEADRRAGTSWHVLRHTATRTLGVKLVAGAGLLATGWLLRRPPGRGESRARRRSGWGAVLPWLSRFAPILLPMLAPLLNRRVALALAQLGVPVVARAVAPLHTVRAFDAERFAGLWYEVARLGARGSEAADTQVLRYYGLDADGVRVVRRRVDAAGRSHDKAGRLRPTRSRQPAELEVSYAPPWLRWFPGAWSDEWVIYIDEDYTCALLGTPERDGLWLLSRDPAPSPEAADILLQLAERLEFPIDRMQWVGAAAR